jgi:hypothetical protein
MPEIVTRFTNDKKHLDKEKNRLKKTAFIPRDLSEISVVGIDMELTQDNADEIIFKIGDLIYKGPKKVKARGDMKVSNIEAITYREGTKIFLECDTISSIPNHYNIKPSLADLEFANNCAYHLSKISTLVIKKF